MIELKREGFEVALTYESLMNLLEAGVNSKLFLRSVKIAELELTPDADYIIRFRVDAERE